MRFYADTIDRLKLELEAAFDALANPQSPQKRFARDEADLPPAADWTDCMVWVPDLAVAVVSDGTDWIDLSTGTAI